MPLSDNTKFRFSARYIFLTYPNSTDINHGDLHDRLRSYEGVDSVYSCRERHESGEFHHHAILKGTKKFNFRDQRYFDIEYGGRNYHPNIEAVRNLRDANTYIGKDGNTRGAPISSERDSKSSKYANLLVTSGGAEEFMEGVKRDDPVNYVLNYQRLEYFTRNRWPDVTEYGNIYNRESFKVPRVLDKWVEENLFNRPSRPKCLVLIGEPGWGKTKWAQSFGVPFNYWCKYITNRRVKDAWYAILDDFDEQKRNEYKGFWGAQEVIGVKTSNGVSGHKQWDWGLPTIWLFNEWPECLKEDGYEAKRSVIVKLNRPLY